MRSAAQSGVDAVREPYEEVSDDLRTLWRAQEVLGAVAIEAHRTRVKPNLRTRWATEYVDGKVKDVIG